MSGWRPVGWSLLVAACVTGSFTFLAIDSKSSTDDEEGDKKYQTKVDTPLVGDYTNFAGLSPIVLEGVGLVVGLNGTGGDPAPSVYRTILMDDLKRRKVPNPNTVLQSPDSALVLVRAYLPPLMKKGETLDLEIRMPDSAEGTSLSGGWLMETYLSEQAFVAGRQAPLKSFAYAVAQGAIMTAGIGSDASTSTELLRRGRVLGGATIMKERELALYLRHDFRSIRNASRVAEVIGTRFHHFDEHGIKKPMAKAKTDQKIVLNVHPRYKDNYPRYLQVIRHMAFRETPVGRRVRMQRLEQDLMIPEKAEGTSLELEAIGNDAIPILKEGLTSPFLECRFHSACALAYLGNSDGLKALVEATRKERAFRVFALAAIATLDDADAHIALRELMNEPISETRYGSFRALWTLDKRDPFIRGETLGVRQQDKTETELEQKKEKRRAAGEYTMHVLDTTGDPLVHALTRTRPEIVLFGPDQEFKTPMYVAAGRNIIVTSQPGASTVSLARFELGHRDEKRETSLKVADVIRAANELGATYPDVVQMLFDASKQKNLPTRLAIDTLPESGRTYYRPANSGDLPSKGRKATMGGENMTPNLFPKNPEPDPDAEMKKAERRAHMANIPHESTKSGDTPESAKKTKITADDTLDSVKSAKSRSRKTMNGKDSDSKNVSSNDDDSNNDDARDSSPKNGDKPRGLFSWFGNWTRSDK